MSRWNIQTSDTRFSAAGLPELQEMARNGRFEAGDLIQPPGTEEWMYAIEIGELSDALKAAEALEADLGPIGGSAGGSAGTIAIGLGLLAVVAGGGYYLWDASQHLPDGDDSIESQISYSELVVTEDGTPFAATPEPGGTVLSSLAGGVQLKLLAKRGDRYRARDEATGSEGWIATDAVLPMYRMGGEEVIAAYDPLYNPDRYLEVMNASWMQLPEQRDSSLTVFQFMLRNTSRYDITDIRIVATIKDEKGHELETVEFAIEGVVPADGHTMVGTLDLSDAEEGARRLMTQATFRELAETDPDLSMKYSEGVEVEMQTAEFQEASIDIAELRAVPGADAPGQG